MYIPTPSLFCLKKPLKLKQSGPILKSFNPLDRRSEKAQDIGLLTTIQQCNNFATIQTHVKTRTGLINKLIYDQKDV